MTYFFASKKHLFILASLIVLASFLIFFRLDRHDMLSDDAHYAFRSIGYFDFMTSNNQTTPVQWFGFRPWWSYLSFHDHPPLFFFLQNLLFKIFGVSVFVSRLLSALAALGSVFLIFFITKLISNYYSALIATAALSVNCYFLWTSRIGLLESCFTFFLLLGLLFFIKSILNKKFFPLAGLFFGLSLLVKYTFFPVAFSLLLFLLIKKREVFFQKEFWIGLLIFFLISSPILIYNLKMYQERGHFDVQLTALFHQSKTDWPILSGNTSFNFSPSSLFHTLGLGLSWPYLFFSLLSFFTILIFSLREKLNLIWPPIFIFLSFILFFSFIGSAERWLGVISPFFALIIGFSFHLLHRWSKNTSFIFLSLFIPISVYSLLYSFNTNHAIAAPKNNWLYSTNLRLENYGYNELDKEIICYGIKISTHYLLIFPLFQIKILKNFLLLLFLIPTLSGFPLCGFLKNGSFITAFLFLSPTNFSPL